MQTSDRGQGPAIMLEAVDLARPMRWPRKLTMEDRAELERLVEDGHQVSTNRRGTVLHLTEDSIRNTILYRTLIHEVGHWVDWKSWMQQPTFASSGATRSQLEAAYFARPLVERERAAHRYWETQIATLRPNGLVPFARMD